jgi:hypothetical protein
VRGKTGKSVSETFIGWGFSYRRAKGKIGIFGDTAIKMVFEFGKRYK